MLQPEVTAHQATHVPPLARAEVVVGVRNLEEQGAGRNTQFLGAGFLPAIVGGQCHLTEEKRLEAVDHGDSATLLPNPFDVRT